MATEVYGALCAAHPMGRLISGPPETDGGLRSDTRDTFKPSYQNHDGK